MLLLLAILARHGASIIEISVCMAER